MRKVITVRVSDELYERFSRYAADHDQSVSELLRHSMRIYTETKEARAHRHEQEQDLFDSTRQMRLGDTT